MTVGGQASNEGEYYFS